MTPATAIPEKAAFDRALEMWEAHIDSHARNGELDECDECDVLEMTHHRAAFRLGMADHAASQ